MNAGLVALTVFLGNEDLVFDTIGLMGKKEGKEASGQAMVRRTRRKNDAQRNLPWPTRTGG